LFSIPSPTSSSPSSLARAWSCCANSCRATVIPTFPDLSGKAGRAGHRVVSGCWVRVIWISCEWHVLGGERCVAVVRRLCLLSGFGWAYCCSSAGSDERVVTQGSSRSTDVISRGGDVQ
jgi:hypothetical protein